MTNGEIIQRDFPNEFLSLITLFTREWWNAEYKEPTTKNYFGVDCISRTPSIPKEWQDTFKDVDEFIEYI